MIKKSFGEFIKGGTVAFVEGAMGYNFLYVIAKMSEGREVMFLSAHLESYQKINDAQGNFTRQFSTGIIARANQAKEIDKSSRAISMFGPL